MEEVSGGRPVSLRPRRPRRSKSSSSRPARSTLPASVWNVNGSDVVLTGRPRCVGVARSRRAATFSGIRCRFPVRSKCPRRTARCRPRQRVSARRLRGPDRAQRGLTHVVPRRPLSRTVCRCRNRRPGDWFRPAGLDGRKKLQDYFVDRKVPRERRDAVPLVVDERDRIVWVAGHRLMTEFRVTDPAQAVIILRLRLWEALFELDLEESVVLDGARRRRRPHLELLDQTPADTRITVRVQRVHVVGRSRARSSRVVITGQEITGVNNDNEHLPYLRSRAVRRSRQQADRARRRGRRRRNRRPARGRRCSIPGRRSC